MGLRRYKERENERREASVVVDGINQRGRGGEIGETSVQKKKETVREQIKESGAYGAVGMYCGGERQAWSVTKESGV